MTGIEPAISEDLIQKFAAIEWFSNLEQTSEHYKRLPLDAALEALEPHWESVLAVSEDNLTVAIEDEADFIVGLPKFMRKVHGEAAPAVEAARQGAKDAGLPAVAVEQAERVITNALVEDAFKKHSIPTFFTELMDAYSAGRLPCAWDGDVEAHGVSQGDLVVC